MLIKPELITKIREKFDSQITDVSDSFGQTVISVKLAGMVSLLEYLRNDPDMEFDVMMDLFGIDYLEMGGAERFAVVYNLFSISHKHRLRIRIFVPESNPKLPSVQHIWPSANWAEREVYDMYGLMFENHPDLRRILCPDNFVGHPLRKDFPLNGIGYREDYEKITRENAQ